MTEQSDYDELVAEQLYELNDAITAWANHYGQLERWDIDEADQRLNDATHAVFNILTGRNDE